MFETRRTYPKITKETCWR